MNKNLSSSFDNIQKFPFIATSNHYLRQLESSDAQSYYRYMNHDAVKEYMAEGIVPASLDESRKIVDDYADYYGKTLFWGITQKNNDLLIGTIGFNFINLLQKKTEVSFGLDHDYWGKKIMKEALEKKKNYLLLNLCVVRVQSTTLTGNKRAINLLEKAKFKKEGVLAKYEPNKHDQDSLMFGLIL